MPGERTLIGQFDEVVETLVRRGDATGFLKQPEIAELVRMAGELRRLPREEFRTRLREELERNANMTTATVLQGARQGFHTITPYLIVRDAGQMVEFMQQAFGAAETMRGIGASGGIHAEVRIGDSMVMVGGPAKPAEAEITPKVTGIHLYVDDVDAIYERAVKAGGVSLYAVADMDYGERSGAVRDAAGNEWYIATAKSKLPPEMRTVNVYLHPYGVDRLLEFVKRAFGAEELGVFRVKPDAPIMHAELRIGDSILEMGEAHDPWLPMPTRLYLYVPDADAAYRQAVAAGAKSLWAPADQPYGDRSGAVEDEWGNQWIVATHRGTSGDRRIG